MSPLSLRRLSDERLSSRLASGEAAAFDELYRRYAHRLAAYGGHLLGDPAAGEDVAHVALMNAYQALRSGRLPERVRPWLYRIAHNAAIDAVTRRRELPYADLLPMSEAETRDQSSVRGALLDALAALPDRQRRAYVLRELHGLRVAEIATELSLTVPQVEQALFSARNRLAEVLVFGERLTCAAARRLASGPLEWAERKAVRSHARSCPSCRTALGRRATVLGLLPALDWLRGVAAAAGGGGGGVAVAKLGAAAATATLVAGLPAAHDLALAPHRGTLVAAPAADRVSEHAARRVAPAVRIAAPPVRPRRRSEAAASAVPQARHERVTSRRGHEAAETSHHGGVSRAAVPRTRVENPSEPGRSGSSGPGPAPAPAPPPATDPAPIVDTSGPGPSGSGSPTTSSNDGSGSGDQALGVELSGSSGSGASGSGASGSDGGSGLSGSGSSGSGSGGDSRGGELSGSDGGSGHH